MLNVKKNQSKKHSVILCFISKINFKLFITLICLAFLGSSIYGNFEALANQRIAYKEILWLLGGIVLVF